MTLLKEQGHEVAAYHLVKDEPAQIKDRIAEGLANEAVQAIIINGGTGISKRDSTFEAVDAMLEKRLVGFGEIFRYLTYQEIGSPGHHEPRHRRHHQRPRPLLHPRLRKRRQAGDGKAHPSRTWPPGERTHQVTTQAVGSHSSEQKIAKLLFFPYRGDVAFCPLVYQRKFVAEFAG